jgi:hypothetical protein
MRESADSFDVLRQSSFSVDHARKHAWNEGVWRGILRYCCGGRRMICRHVTAFVVAAPLSQFPAIFLQHSISAGVIAELVGKRSSGDIAVRRATKRAKARLDFTLDITNAPANAEKPPCGGSDVL